MVDISMVDISLLVWNVICNIMVGLSIVLHFFMALTPSRLQTAARRAHIQGFAQKLAHVFDSLVRSSLPPPTPPPKNKKKKTEICNSKKTKPRKGFLHYGFN